MSLTVLSDPEGSSLDCPPNQDQIICGNISVLVIFKYFNFLSSNLGMLVSLVGSSFKPYSLETILPIGLSFHTFQAMSYTIEVYFRRQKAEKHIGYFALFVLFYPQLVAGPIERPQVLIPQLHEEKKLSFDNLGTGLKWMLLGFCKKVIIGDRLGLLVDRVYNHPTQYSAPMLFLATILFTCQIYADFSGYTDIARGAAKTMGFNLSVNFNAPFLARSIGDYWRRWHISLSTWFRDYVYFPLGGSRRGVPRMYFNLMFTFFISGLWHGAGWTFVLWGGLNGFYLVTGHLLRPIRATFNKVLRLNNFPTFISFLQLANTYFLVVMARVLFRSTNIKNAAYVYKSFFTQWRYLNPAQFIRSIHAEAICSSQETTLVAILILCLFIGDYLNDFKNGWEFIERKPAYLRAAFYLILIQSIVIWGIREGQFFIYFQF